MHRVRNFECNKWFDIYNRWSHVLNKYYYAIDSYIILEILSYKINFLISIIYLYDLKSPIYLIKQKT